MTAQARLLGGRYQVGELLGYGGMAEVHKGRDLRLGRDVAIKMLRTDLARDATFQERFRREAQNSAALNHPAIVAVYDTGEEISATGEKLPFIVMEFVNGRTLKEVLAAEQRIQPRRALEMIADICAALEFSHRHGIIHRDIKPGNVMVTQNGQVKVMDFGIARALASGATTMTQTSAVIGTAQYLSPEQARGESVDARSDVYAAGCVLFELLVGHPPFVGDSPVSVAYQHVREDPKAPSDINREVPPELDAIVLKALAKNPLNRYQSAQEMRADALRAVSGRPVLATPVMTAAETMAMHSPMPNTQPTMVNRPVPGAVLPPEPPPRTSNRVTAVLAAVAILVVIALGVGLALNRNKDKTPETPQVQIVAVPDVTGKSEQEARSDLTDQGFTNVALGDPIPTDDCKDEVEKQVPPADTKVAVTERITIQLCAAPELVTVPNNLVNSQQELAEQTLRQIGLDPRVKDVSSDKAEGTVTKVEKQGQKVKPGTSITIEVSRGNLVEVPDVSNRSFDQAKAILETAGFNVSQDLVSQDGVPGAVVGQSPKAGEKRARGDTITLKVVDEQDEDPEPSGSPSTAPPGAGGSGPDGGGVGGGLGDLID